MHRRSFLKKASAVSLFAALPLSLTWKKAYARVNEFTNRTLFFWKTSPLQLLSASQANSIEFNGDDPDAVHDIIWHVDTYIKQKGGIPPVTEEHDLVIVGGGLGGLTAAYQLRDFKPLVLELAQQFGGNAKAERFGDTDFPIGAVYISNPEPGSSTHKLLTEIGVLKKGRVEDSHETTVYFNNNFARGFWHGATDPETKAHFTEVYEELNSWLTDPAKAELLAFKTNPLSAEAKRLDSMTFADWLKERFGQVHPRLMEYFQLYGWSSFLGSVDELSALQMLDFITAETDKIMSFPGGLGAISQGLYEKLHAQLPEGNLRAKCLTVDIRQDGDGVRICYNDPQNNLKTIRAKTVVYAGPKFIAERIIRDVSREQYDAWHALSYRAYVVGNVILDSPIQCPSFELYCLEGEMPPTPTFVHPSTRNFSDVCFGSWASHDKTKNGVITVYSGFSYDGAHQYLFAPGSHDKHKQRILTGLKPILKLLGKSEKNVLGVRLTRWGHPMPIAYKDLLTRGIPQKAREPMYGRLFFANQDNWANPCFETTFREARIAAEQIRKILG